MFDFSFDDSQLLAAIHRLNNANASLEPALKVIGLKLVESTKQRFETSIAPNGAKWEPNKPITLAKKRSTKPLIDSGTLMRQIDSKVIGNELLIYSTLEYAAMQQFGGTKLQFPHLWGDIPARPYLGISATDDAMIQRVLDNYLKSLF